MARPCGDEHTLARGLAQQQLDPVGVAPFQQHVGHALKILFGGRSTVFQRDQARKLPCQGDFFGEVALPDRVGQVISIARPRQRQADQVDLFLDRLFVEQAHQLAELFQRPAGIADFSGVVTHQLVDTMRLKRAAARLAGANAQHHRRPERLELRGHEGGNVARLHLLGKRLPVGLSQKVGQGRPLGDEHDRRVLGHVALHLRLILVRNLEIDLIGRLYHRLERLKMRVRLFMAEMVRAENRDLGAVLAGDPPQQPLGIEGCGHLRVQFRTLLV